MPQQTVSEAVITHVASQAHATALHKGFWEGIDPFLAELNTKLMLIVSEVAEAQEVMRNEYEGELNPYSRMTEQQGEDFVGEIADVIIRAFDLCAYFTGITSDIGDAVIAKMAKNDARPHKHSKRF